MAEAKADSSITLDIKIKMTLTIEEAKALAAMTGYGAKSFLEGYYKQLGKSYMQPHEKGVYSLFETINKTLPSELRKVENIVEAIKKIPV